MYNVLQCKKHRDMPSHLLRLNSRRVEAAVLKAKSLSGDCELAGFLAGVISLEFFPPPHLVFVLMTSWVQKNPTFLEASVGEEVMLQSEAIYKECCLLGVQAGRRLPS